MAGKVARRSALGVLLAAWWADKQARQDGTVTLCDAAILAGLGLCWLLEHKPEPK